VSAAPHIPFRDPDLIMVEDFEAMDLPDACKWELIDGEVVSVTFPDLEHVDIQHRLARFLETLFGSAAIVRVELPFATGQYDKNGADVGAAAPHRYRANRKRLEGSPELVIEVVSKSNREKKLGRLQDRCFQYGCRQFWRVYPKKRTVTIARQEDGSVAIMEYGPGEIIPISMFGVDGQIPVDEIFT
jgi:Uma2 family endonuclease